MRPGSSARAVSAALLFVAGLGFGLPPTAPVAATVLDATGATFRFGVTGQTITDLGDLDTPLPAGSSILFTEVATVNGTAVDSRVTFVRGTNLGNASNNTPSGHIARIDDGRASSVGAAYVEHRINRETSGTPAMAEIRVDFYVSGTTTPVTLSNLAANFYDLDVSEAVEVEGLSSYTLSDNTHLTTTSAASGAVRFQAPGGSTTTSDPVLTAYTVGRLKANFTNTSSVTYRLHMPASSNNFDFNVDFSAGQPWIDNGQVRVENVTAAPPSLSPSLRTVTTVVNCPVSLAPALASNFDGSITYAVTSGILPTGLTLNTNTGAITGTTTATSAATVGITGTGATSGTATAQVAFAIANPALTLAPATQSVTGTTGAWIDDTPPLTPSGACGTVSYAVTTGSLPTGVTLDSATGVISGVPTTTSNATVTITATDAIGRTATTSATFAIVPPPSTLDATGATFRFGVTGQTVESTADLNTPRPPGTSITYRRVSVINGIAVDAVVTFVEGANLGNPAHGSTPAPIGYVRQVDEALGSSSNRPYLEHEIRTTTSAQGWARFRVDFYVANTYSTPGTGSPVSLSNVATNFYDVDELQAVEVYGAIQYSLATNTHLTVATSSAGSVTFTSGPGSTTDSSPTLSAFTVGRASVRFAPASSFTYRVVGPANDFALFDVDFSSGQAWTDNLGGVEVETAAPPSLTPAAQTVTGLARCPISTTPPVAANFGGIVSYVSTSGIAPPGMTFSTSTGVFGGTPTSASTATVDITATGSVSGSATTQVTFAITNSAMTLAPATQSVTGTAGTPITASTAMVATNPCSTVTYAVTSGNLPTGLSLDATTGAITGTPTEGSTATITITATDTTGPSRTATATVTFDITGPSAPSAASLPPAVSELVTQPVPMIPTTAPSTTTPSTSVPPTTTAPPAPVPAPNGDLPDLDSTDTLVTENGDPVEVELVVENDSDLVLRNQDFELRLRGNCTTGCTITEDTTGRETIHLDRNGTARVSGFGFLPGSLVHVWIFSEPRYLGALLVAPDGTYDGSFPLTDIDVGSHTLQANGISLDNLPRSANLGIIVTDNALPTPDPTTLPATGTSNATPLWVAILLALMGSSLSVASRRRTRVN